MKRFLTIVCLFVFTITIFTGCSSEYQKQELQSEIEELQKQSDKLQSDIEHLKSIRDGLISQDDTAYVITLEVSQSHFSLDLDEHLKDSINKIELPIEVSESYYYSVEIGDIINNDLRVGSLIFKGSIGNWDVKVKDKNIVLN